MVSVLVFNVGSSSLKFCLFDTSGGKLVRITGGSASKLGSKAEFAWSSGEKERLPLRDFADAALHVAGRLAELHPSVMEGLTATGHRVVHGGNFSSTVRIDARVLGKIESLAPLAPIHQLAAVAVIKALRRHFGRKIASYAVFDTAFFSDLPTASRCYALPSEIVRKHNIRRYGFHGIAHRSLLERYLQMSDADPDTSRVISFQLGQGCSVAAIHGGRPIDTSMGFTPLEGLIMGTRPGDVDPGVILYLIQHAGMNPAKLSDLLNHGSGLLGMSGTSADMAQLLALEQQGDAAAAMAVGAFCSRARKYLGAYLAVLGGADAVVFGGGIGEHAPEIRERICARMEWAGLVLNASANASAVAKNMGISHSKSNIAVYVTKTDEEAVIAGEVFDRCQPAGRRSNRAGPS